MNISYDFRRFPSFKHLRACLLVLFGLVYSFQVSAGSYPATQSGNTVTYGAGSYDSDAVAAGAAMAVSAGAVYASQSKTIRTAAGVAASVMVRGAPVAGAIANSLRLCLGNPVCAVATAAAAAYVANELSFDLVVDSAGVPTVRKSDPSVCTVAPCYSYNANSQGFSGSYSSLSSACSAYPSTTSTANQSAALGGTVKTVVGPYNTTQCQFVLNDGRTVYPTVVSRVSVSPSAPVYGPSSVDEFSTAVGAKTGWSDTSKIPQLVDDVVKAGARQFGTTSNPYIIPLTVPTSITGPATVAGTPTVTTKADGSKVTKTTTSNLGYYPPAVQVTETTVETATTAGGVTTTTSTTTQPATAVPPDTDACATRPNSNGCRTDEFDIPTENLPKATKAITFQAENLGFAGGSCPANVVQNLHGRQTTLVNWSQNCSYITTYAKPMILALATFAALIIIFVGGKPE